MFTEYLYADGRGRDCGFLLIAIFTLTLLSTAFVICIVNVDAFFNLREDRK